MVGGNGIGVDDVLAGAEFVVKVNFADFKEEPLPLKCDRAGFACFETCGYFYGFVDLTIHTENIPNVKWFVKFFFVILIQT